MLSFHGAWRITVVSKSADFDQRVVVRTDYGDRVLPGRPGATLEVDLESWRLSVEHLLWGRSWQPNLRTVPGPVTEQDGLRSRLLTSNDCQWPGKPLDHPNLVVRLDQVVAAKSAPAAAPLPAATRSIRTSSTADYSTGLAPRRSTPAADRQPAADPSPGGRVPSPAAAAGAVAARVGEAEQQGE
ncbi:hypothetical protein [Kitasatospora acidiphila]|uniref:hypothetical protein n=1 Tax=Kitasatospora acidiphila TaxID=2567942 RepID=UPI003C7389E8